MTKRKPRRNKGKELPPKPLLDFISQMESPSANPLECLPVEIIFGNYPIEGIGLPPDLDAAMRRLVMPHVEMVRRSLQHPYVIHHEKLRHSVYRDQLFVAARAGFMFALLRYADELKHAPEVASILEQWRENGEILAAEGRAAKAENDKRRAAIVCKMYRSVRPAHPPGRKGNGEACRVVADRYESQERESIDPKTVRETAQKAGIADPPRRERKD
jgi:hypothetical protein